jgi:hypothetical protein
MGEHAIDSIVSRQTASSHDITFQAAAKRLTKTTGRNTAENFPTAIFIHSWGAWAKSLRTNRHELDEISFSLDSGDVDRSPKQHFIRCSCNHDRRSEQRLPSPHRSDTPTRHRPMSPERGMTS